MKEISVVIPVYKSEKCIPELTKQISDALKDFNWELILVNDCSPDNSWKEIKKVAAENNNITGINNNIVSKFIPFDGTGTSQN